MYNMYFTWSPSEKDELNLRAPEVPSEAVCPVLYALCLAHCVDQLRHCVSALESMVLSTAITVLIIPAGVGVNSKPVRVG